jgi:hypothetical protein
MIRAILTILAFILIPYFWVLFVILGANMTIKDMFNEWNNHRLSGDKWGVFD